MWSLVDTPLPGGAFQTLLFGRLLLNVLGHLGQEGLVVLHEDGVAVVPLQVQPHRPDRLRVLDETVDSKLGQQIVELLFLVQVAIFVFTVDTIELFAAARNRSPIFHVLQ